MCSRFLTLHNKNQIDINGTKIIIIMKNKKNILNFGLMRIKYFINLNI